MTEANPGPGVAAAGLSRRRVLAAAGGVAAVGGLVAVSVGGVLATRPAERTSLIVDAATARRLADLSRTLCGGGAFDPDQATMLLELLATDDGLSRGVVDLLLAPPVAGTAQALSPEAEAARRAILHFWYVGAFKGEPIANRGAVYDHLTAWQAMYTPPFALCKAYGQWAEAPDDEPAVPSI